GGGGWRWRGAEWGSGGRWRRASRRTRCELRWRRAGLRPARGPACREPPCREPASSSSGDLSAGAALARPGLVGEGHLVDRLIERAARSFLDLAGAPALGDQACGTKEHHQDDDHAVDPERVLRDVDLVRGREDVRV